MINDSDMNRHHRLINNLVKNLRMTDPDTSVIETHISTVILSSDSAYKIKKPVDFGFLDFSSLEKRENFCKEELRINSRFAPALYNGILAIGGSESYPAMGEKENIIEYAVYMKRFDQKNQLDNVASAGGLTQDIIQNIAKKVIEFHKIAEKADSISDYGSFSRVLKPITENFEMIDKSMYLPKSTLEKICRIKAWSFKKHRQLKAFFTYRKKNGFVRECHGDLHLKNIAMIDNEIVPFDAIEFNPYFRWIDVISDLSFLLMDLDFISKKDFSNMLLNIYMEATTDYESLTALNFYKTYRAMVKIKVTSLRLNQKDITLCEKKRLVDEINSYADLAVGYTSEKKPILAILHGLSGSGKSRCAQFACGITGAIRIRSDAIRMMLFKDNIYTQEATEATYNKLRDIASMLLDEGFSVFVDATFLKERQRMLFKELAMQKNTTFFILATECSDEIAKSRIKKRLQNKSDISQADVKIYDLQKEHAQALSDIERKETLKIDCGTAESMERDVLDFLGFYAVIDDSKMLQDP